MTQQDHEAVMELIPAYAIGAADAGERATVDAHLNTCAECRDLVEDYRAMTEDLAFAAPLAAAPVGLTEDLRKRLAAGAAAPARRTWLDSLRLARWPAVALVVAALALLVLTNVYWAGRVSRLQSEADRMAALAKAPGIALRVANSGGGGYDGAAGNGVVYVQPGSNVALLCVYALPEPGPGKTYQAWLVENGQRVSAGTFGVNREGYGVLLINSAKPVSEYQQLGITVEPEGGSPAPTTPRVMGGEL
jgi:anti-sigma-K factor RskA